MAQRHNRATVKATSEKTSEIVGSIPTSRNEIFDNFARSGKVAKRGVEFHHLKRNASRIQQKESVKGKCLNENVVS